MSNERTFIVEGQSLRSVMLQVWNLVSQGVAAGPVEVVARCPGKRRSLSQNAKLWPMLTDIARQVQWPVDGAMQELAPEDWKDILTAGVRKEQRVAQGIEGGFVMLGSRTSKMRKKEFAELIEFIYWFGSERGVQWSEPALRTYEQYREVAA